VTLFALVRGIGDVGSAVAHALHREGFKVLIHDVPSPPWTRRRMAFTDAVFDGEALLSGVRAVRVDELSSIESVLADSTTAVSVHEFEVLLQALRPDILVDARMRKRQIPERQIDLARFTVGLGPNFTAQHTTHIVIETAWGDALGAVIRDGISEPHEGEPRVIGGYGIERVVYAPVAGIFASDFAIGDTVAAGQIVAHVGNASLGAPLDGWLRGLTRSGVPVTKGTKVIEIDPRGEDAVISGIGERPAKIADGVIRAVREWAFSS
jgi:xanthine dehydrogenase accessory factor